MNKNEIVLFETEDNEVKLEVPVREETVWLSANQMSALFDRDEKTIRKHINNAFSDGEVDKNNNTQKMRVEGVKQLVPYYTLDVIISVGYRVKSKRGVEFRRWANSVLKQYILQGYAVNDKRIAQLGEVIKIMKRTENTLDGNKRIAATMFLYFLDRNGALFTDGEKLIDDYTLVALTIMIAESRPEEKEMMITVIMNCLA